MAVTLDPRPLLVVTPGMGVGPEVTARGLVAARARLRGFRVALIGDPGPICQQAEAAGLTLEDGPLELAPRAPESIRLVRLPEGPEPVEVAAIRRAAAACLAGEAAAMVTGPIHKERLARRGFAFCGHTDFLGHLCGVDTPVMAFVGGELRVALVTDHLPLMAVGAALTGPRIQRVVRVAADALCRSLGFARPRVAVCGLNPHAGDGGVLGREEIETILPACQALRAEGLAVEGPVSAETAFLRARGGAADLVVAMYHDQGLAPLKAVDFGRSVNWSLGLPIVRTSVDHGTADDLVGTGRADPSSMVAALTLAAQVVVNRSRPDRPTEMR